MRDEDKPKQQLINELIEIRQQIEELETIQNSLLTESTEYKQITETLYKNEMRWSRISHNLMDLVRMY